MAAQPEGREEKYAPSQPRKLFSATQACRKLTIYEVSRGLRHVPLIDKNPRGKEVLPMAPHEALRYNERTASERFNSRLKEEFGGKNVRVRGY